jgi:hypothetical protein
MSGIKGLTLDYRESIRDFVHGKSGHVVNLDSKGSIVGDKSGHLPGFFDLDGVSEYISPGTKLLLAEKLETELYKLLRQVQQENTDF